MKTILVIEDEQSVRDSILDLLEAEGFRGIGGENGKIGVQLAHDHAPDLILCDIQLPQLDGFGVLTSLRQSPATAGIPVIFLSANATKADMRQGMQLGADDYLMKPCTVTDLLGAISGRLAKQESFRQQFTQSTPPSTAVAPYQTQPEFLQAPSTPTETVASPSRDSLLNHFYQELRNPLSSINMTLHLLKAEMLNGEPILRRPSESVLQTVQQEYGRELAILQQVYKLQDFLIPESAAMLRACNLLDGLEEGM